MGIPEDGVGTATSRPVTDKIEAAAFICDLRAGRCLTLGATHGRVGSFCLAARRRQVKIAAAAAATGKAVCPSVGLGGYVGTATRGIEAADGRPPPVACPPNKYGIRTHVRGHGLGSVVWNFDQIVGKETMLISYADGEQIRGQEGAGRIRASDDTLFWSVRPAGHLVWRLAFVAQHLDNESVAACQPGIGVCIPALDREGSCSTPDASVNPVQASPESGSHRVRHPDSLNSSKLLASVKSPQTEDNMS